MIGDVFNTVKTDLAAALNTLGVTTPVPLYLGGDRIEWQDVPPRIVMFPTTMSFAGAGLAGPRGRLDYQTQWGLNQDFEVHIWGVRANGDVRPEGDFEACEMLLDVFLSTLRNNFTGSVNPGQGRWEIPGHDGKVDSDSEFEVGRLLVVTVSVGGVLVQPQAVQTVRNTYESTNLGVPNGNPDVADLVNVKVGGP